MCTSGVCECHVAVMSGAELLPNAGISTHASSSTKNKKNKNGPNPKRCAKNTVLEAKQELKKDSNKDESTLNGQKPALTQELEQERRSLEQALVKTGANFLSGLRRKAGGSKGKRQGPSSPSSSSASDHSLSGDEAMSTTGSDKSANSMKGLKHEGVDTKCLCLQSGMCNKVKKEIMPQEGLSVEERADLILDAGLKIIHRDAPVSFAKAEVKCAMKSAEKAEKACDAKDDEATKAAERLNTLKVELRRALNFAHATSDEIKKVLGAQDPAEVAKKTLTIAWRRRMFKEEAPKFKAHVAELSARARAVDQNLPYGMWKVHNTCIDEPRQAVTDRLVQEA